MYFLSEIYSLLERICVLMAKLPFNDLLCLMQKRFLASSKRLYSSSSPSSSLTLSSASYTTRFLVKSCGLPLESAVSISQKLILDEKKLPKYMSVIEVLKSYAFSNTDIAKLVSKHPGILRNEVNRLKLKVEYLQENGFVGPALHATAVSNPTILKRSLDKYIKPTFDFLKEFLETDEKVVAAVKRGPRLLSFHLNGIMKPNAFLLMKEGVPRTRMSQLILLQPRAIMQNVDRMACAIEMARSLDIKPTELSYIIFIGVFVSMAKSKWEGKVELYKKLGLTDVDISKAIKRQPHFMACSEEKIKILMDFYKNTMKLNPSVVATYPKLLLYSFETRIQPRFNVLKILASKNLLKGKKFAWLFTQSEARFLANYVTKYLDQVPNLMELYRGVKKTNL